MPDGFSICAVCHHRVKRLLFNPARWEHLSPRHDTHPVEPKWYVPSTDRQQEERDAEQHKDYGHVHDGSEDGCPWCEHPALVDAGLRHGSHDRARYEVDG